MGFSRAFWLFLLAFALTSGAVAASTLETFHGRAADDFQQIKQYKIEPASGLSNASADSARNKPMNSISEKISDVQAFYAVLQGEWQGRYHLWLNPTTPVESSDSSAQIAKDPGKSSWVMSYQWARGTEDHQGEFHFKGTKNQGHFSWTDSFHSPSSPMHGEGKLSKEGTRLIFMSHYSPGAGEPEWGWRTEITLVDATTFQLEAYNITPQGQEVLAVRCRYVKK